MKRGVVLHNSSTDVAIRFSMYYGNLSSPLLKTIKNNLMLSSDAQDILSVGISLHHIFDMFVPISPSQNLPSNSINLMHINM